MTISLKERYEQRQQVLAEGFLDYFKAGSENIQKFNTTLASLKKTCANVSSCYASGCVAKS
jgi:hypothetical protein